MTLRITSLTVYPIKSLRGISLNNAELTPQGIKHDRVFMLYAVKPNNKWEKMQLSHYPQCALFDQRIATIPNEGSTAGNDRNGKKSMIIVEYNPPKGSRPDEDSANKTGSKLSTVPSKLEVPLEPDISTLECVDVELHGSPASAYRMGGAYDEWFASCIGIPVVLVYIGDGKRPVLGETLDATKLKSKASSPKEEAEKPGTATRGWISSLTSYISSATTSKPKDEPAPWLTFTDVAPLLIASESSLNDVSSRLSQPASTPSPASLEVGMYKFRPNLVVAGQDVPPPAWDEDYWGELEITTREKQTEARKVTLLLTGNCVRCTSLNVDYETGRPAEGELGSVLKKLMKDRRVDKGSKWSPVFGRYASVDFDSGSEFEGEDAVKSVWVSVGDEVQVTRRIEERSVWDWPGL
ncbi:molybdenum cofactor sulfurase [Rhypophila decipiens]|uniref:Molybdenum cofactor sulfurase n=1 Tax=Rhypophila decipiens TaxID=261697 RepID=A0AAN6Y3K0_9PEZI|nr:molybdenum cofactor sulfurase [Rhypophila decipiens]